MNTGLEKTALSNDNVPQSTGMKFRSMMVDGIRTNAGSSARLRKIISVIVSFALVRDSHWSREDANVIFLWMASSTLDSK
jgi:hypothetical protein